MSIIIKMLREKNCSTLLITCYILICLVQYNYQNLIRSGPEVIKLFTCSTQLSMEVFLLINVKMPTIVGILTFMSGKNSIFGLSESEKKLNFLIFLYL